MDNAVDRHVFYISDGTAITAEVLGHAVMSQFPVTISSITLPFVENESRARAVKDQIDAIYHQTGVRPLVFYSIVLPEIRAIILQSEGFCQDIVQALVAPLQQEMKLDPRRLLIVPMALTLIISINMMRALLRLITPSPTMMAFRYAIWTRLR